MWASPRAWAQQIYQEKKTQRRAEREGGRLCKGGEERAILEEDGRVEVTTQLDRDVCKHRLKA